MVGVYSVQEWAFNSAYGRYKIDLGESAVQFQRVQDVTIRSDWPLDYTSDRGLEATRQAVADLYGGRVNASDVLIAHGAQEALYLFYQSFLSAGDHVITTVPGWQQSWELPAHLGCGVSKLHWHPGAPLDVETLEGLIRPQTRLLILTNPGNPSGCSVTDEEWASICRIADRHRIWILSDEEYLLDFTTSVALRYSRAVSVSGLSKVYGLQGLRAGWAATASRVGAEIIERMVNYKRYTTMCNSMLSEGVLQHVLADRENQVRRYHTLLDAGRVALDEFADANPETVELVPPEGTPFAWLDLDLPISSLEFTERLLKEQAVLVMPGEFFGGEQGIRLTFARPEEDLREGLPRVTNLLKKVLAGS